MQDRRSDLWRDGDFLKLWLGQTISLFGSQITTLALPLTAVLLLDATPAQIGALGAAQFAPFLLLTLFAGVWVDRVRRRPLMVGATMLQALLLGAVPLIAWRGLLRMEYLYAIIFLLGVFEVCFELAYQAYFPALVGQDRLIGANSRLQGSYSAASLGGPGLAGLLIQAFTAPVAVLFDALSFLLAAVGIALIRAPEPTPAPATREPIWRGIGEGLRLVCTNPYLRAMAGEATVVNLCLTALQGQFVLYATRELGFSPGLLGLILALGSLGSVLGAALAPTLHRRLGIGPALLLTYLLGCLAPLIIPLADGPRPLLIATLIAGFFLLNTGSAGAQVYVWSLRQSLVPAEVLGRMNAAYRFFVTGMVPIGALLGGALASTIGLRPTLLVAALGGTLALGWVIASPLPRLRALPGETSKVQKEEPTMIAEVA